MTAIVLSEGVCDFCQSDTAILTCDLLYRLEDITAHYFCLLFSSGLGQRGEDCDGIRGFLASDIRRELRRGARLKCVFCKKKGATVGCAEAACKKSYHLNCGARHDCLMQFFGQFKSLCSRHRARPRARRSAATPTTCTICQQELGGARGKRDHSILTSGCCDTATFHRDCVQQLSVSAGRAHFRCPNCNDTASWVAAMLEAGVYVPEQDASWEQEPGPDTAPPRLCHAKLCFCPHEAGRAHHSEHGLWEILTCDACGHKVSHLSHSALLDAMCSPKSEIRPEATPHTVNTLRSTHWKGLQSLRMTKYDFETSGFA